jgi:glycosyltransferase involved in cell wall biosynthesis
MGGAETSLINLLDGLIRRNQAFRPFVIATERGPFIARCAEMGIPNEVLDLPTRLERLGDSPAEGRAPQMMEAARVLRCAPDFTSYSRGISKLLRRENPDVIHTNGFKMHIVGAWVTGRSNAKRRPALVGHIHDYVSTRPLAGKLLKAGASRFSRFIANSRSVAGDVQTFLRSERVSTVYNAIDLTRFHPEGLKADLDTLCGLEPAAKETIRVGLVATFAKWKGHRVFLRALARLNTTNRVRGYIIGGPIYRTASSQFSLNELQAEAAELGLAGKVGFTGFMEDVPSAIRALDIVVHASTQPEPFGMTIVEGMACERPLVISNLGGARELFVDGVSAFGHTAGDEQHLACIIDRLVSDQGLRRRIAREAREHVSRHFHIPEMTRRIWDIYSDAISPSALTGH